MDAITLLENEHHSSGQLFTSFERAGDRAYVTKRHLVDQMIEELSVYAAIEEQLFYPVTRATVPGTEDMALEGLEEHHVVKWLLAELERLDPHDERFDAKVRVLIGIARHHSGEEEREYFPLVRDELGHKALAELGDAMEEAKATAPTHPHPRAPQTPPVAALAGIVDRVGDTVSGAAQGGVTAVQELIDRIRGSKRRHAAPQGTSTARHTARSVRSGADRTVDDVIELVSEAKSTGKQTTEQATETVSETVQAAKTGAKRTATSARKGAKRTATTAKQAVTTTTNTATRN